ncbi:MAG: hypothetical protein NC218_04290 [Acetobacter sp.]|nr:hypothetical protein [Acetobacter sp.]
MKKLDGNIIKLFGLITQLPQDAVGIWEFYNKKDYGSAQTLKWFIRGLCLAGALPVYGLKNNPDFDWLPQKD